MADLLNTSDVPLGPHATTTETVLPDWYTNYAMGILSNQQQVAQQPYTPYQGPRVADFTPDQQASFSQTRDAATAYQPDLNASRGVLTGALSAPTGSAAASHYLTASAATVPSVVSNYLDPYISNVTDRIASLGNENLMKNIIPGIGDQFISAGGYGGSRQAEAIGKSILDTQRDITSQQLGALSGGYNSSVAAAQTDLARQGALGATAGNLATNDKQVGIQGAGALSDLGAREQSLGLTGAGALSAIGQQQQDLGQKNLDTAYQDFLRQQGYPQEQIDAMSKTLTNVAPAVPKSVLETGYAPVSTAGQTSSPSTAQTIANLAGAWLLSK